MASISYSKIIKGLAILAVIVVLAVPDMILEWLEEFTHLVAETGTELSDLLFEALEAGLDYLIENILKTDRYTTQIVVFYIIIVILAALTYFLGRWLVNAYRHLTDGFIVFWEVNKARAYLFWHSLTLANKIKLVAVGIMAIAGYLLFLA